MGDYLGKLFAVSVVMLAAFPAAAQGSEGEYTVELPDDGAGQTADANAGSYQGETASPPAPQEGAREPKAMAEPEEEQKEKDRYLDFFTVAIEAGYLYFMREELTVQGFTAVVEPRNGFIAKLHFDIGNKGPALELAPLFAIEFGGINTGGGVTNFDVNLADASLYAVGGYLGFAYRFSVKDRFYPHLGFGFQGTYLMGNDIDYGTELFGRVPIGFTAYMAKGFAFVFEVGLMYGVTGIKMPLKLPTTGVYAKLPTDVRAELESCSSISCVQAWATNPQNQRQLLEWYNEHRNDPEIRAYDKYQNPAAAAANDFIHQQVASTMRYGQGFGLDLMIGFRFP